jgi:hypothetical protein
MICPGCRAEYRDGFYTCSDCDLALVAPESLGSARADAESPFGGEFPDATIPFLETSDPDLLSHLIVELETAGVPYAIEAGTALGLLTGDEVDAHPGIWESRLRVPADQRVRASEILDELARTRDEEARAAAEQQDETQDQ